MNASTWEVLCSKHGRQDPAVNYAHKSVRVGAPKHKRQRNVEGCPFCKAERAAEKSQVTI